MPVEAVKKYQAAAAAERKAFEALQNKAGTPDYEELKNAWVAAIKRTEAARSAMLQAWGVDLSGSDQKG